MEVRFTITARSLDCPLVHDRSSSAAMALAAMQATSRSTIRTRWSQWGAAIGAAGEESGGKSTTT
jgi:hypothetical protein